MKFITVTATFQYVCLVDEDEDRWYVAESNCRDAFLDLGVDQVDYEWREGIHCDGWDDLCIPYNSDGNIRTGEYKKMMEKQ